MLGFTVLGLEPIWFVLIALVLLYIILTVIDYTNKPKGDDN